MRLIDADAMIKELGISDRDIYCKCLIEEQPTAFDVEAVVKELEKMKLVRVEQCHEDYEIEVMTASNFDDAIEIVRKGGVK